MREPLSAPHEPVRCPGGIVVGLPTRCEAATIGAHVRRVDDALGAAAFGREAVIVNADNGSPDGTAETFRSVPTRHRKVALTTGAGKGDNEAALFAFALRSGAAVLVTLDADLEAVPHDWLPALAGPVLAGSVDLVVPLYARFWYDGTITNQIVAPLLLAVTGEPIRQPIGGEYAFSPRAMRALTAHAWPAAALGFGWDIHMVATALRLGLRYTQAALSYGKVHSWRGDRPEDIERDMRRKIAEVVTATFGDLAGLPVPVNADPPPFPVAPPLGRPPKEYDLDPAAELTAGYWRRDRDSAWTRRLLGPRRSPSTDGYPLLDNRRWAGVLARALCPVPSTDLLRALHTLYFVRQLRVLPRYRTMAPADVDTQVHALAVHLRRALGG